MSKVSNDLIKRIIVDIKENPEKLDRYLQLLAKHGMLKNVKTLKLKKVSSDLLRELNNQGSTVIIK